MKPAIPIMMFGKQACEKKNLYPIWSKCIIAMASYAFPQSICKAMDTAILIKRLRFSLQLSMYAQKRWNNGEKTCSRPITSSITDTERRHNVLQFHDLAENGKLVSFSLSAKR
ncbi:hypothetical protein GHT06_015735 [Daphnia sinensis]|uniref:Uncharacterized protein n=1 Tax=Daphnia sinensis TaxID=1820382 RepID=A0AAD5PXH1_9CRUS|nr:hypothetical protein GHT06_015735 [Daphnia sinensis]